MIKKGRNDVKKYIYTQKKNALEEIKKRKNERKK